MERFKQKKLLSIFKILVGLFILVLLILGIRGFTGSFKLSILERGMDNISTSGFIITIVLGIIAFLPMCFYDWLINRKMGLGISLGNIFKYGWIVNSAAISTGLSNATGVGLRAVFYKDKIKDKELLLRETTKISILNPLGLSILSIVYLIFYFNTFNPSDLIVVLAALYTPAVIVYILIKYKDKMVEEYKYFSFIAVIAIIQWLLKAILFFSIVFLIGVNVSINKLFPIYILSIILGIVSMLPGAIGAFDLSILIGFSNIGVSKEFIILAIFIYRVVYYIIPLIIAGILFLIDFWNNTNTKLKSTVIVIGRKGSFIGLKTLIFLSGVSLLLSNAVPGIVYRIRELKFLSYATEMHFSKELVIIVGFLLIVMSTLIKYKVKSIHYLTVGFLVVGMLLTMIKSFNYIAAGYLIIVALIVAMSKEEFSKESFVIGIETIILNLVLLGGFWIIFLVVAYYSIPLKIIGIQRMFKAMYVYRNLVGFSTIGFLVGGFLLTIMYNIGKYKNKIIHQSVNNKMEEINRILDKYNGTSLTHLIYLKDKYVYLSDKYEGLIQYSVYSNKLMVLGNPIGNDNTLKEFIEEFCDFADNYGYIPIFFEVNGKMIEVLHEFGYEFMKLGEAAVVNVSDFTIAGQKMQKVRTCCNKINREGYSFDVINGPFSKELITELKDISDKWLAGKKEMGFSMGYFDEEYINKGPLGIVRDSNGVLKAFVTIMPTYGENKRFCSDLMRFSRDTPRGVMDYMFVQLIEWGKSNGYEIFDFGVAPLSNVGTSKHSFLSERLAYQLYYYGQRFYSFEGLKKFKGKYAHSWESKFLAYKSKAKLPITALQANLNISNTINNKKIKK